MKVRIIPHRRDKAAWNLALEEALYINAKEKLDEGREIEPIVKLYSWKKPSVILGYRQNINEVDHEYINENKIDFTMRTTGGGSVYLGREDMQYSIITPRKYSLELLKNINFNIKNALKDVGLPSQIVNKNNHPVVRVAGKGSIFDAQRRYKNLLLHHGTTLVNNNDYEHMPQSLKATSEELKTLQTGNLWLKQLQQVKEKALIKAFEKNLPEQEEIKIQDYTDKEINIARKLYRNWYSNPAAFDKGTKKFGICYLTSTGYDMDWYAEKD